MSNDYDATVSNSNNINNINYAEVDDLNSSNHYQSMSPPRNMMIVPTSVQSSTPVTSNIHHAPRRNNTNTNNNNNSIKMTNTPTITTKYSPTSHSMSKTAAHNNLHHNALNATHSNNITTSTPNNKRLYRTAVTSVTKGSMSSNNNNNDPASTSSVVTLAAAASANNNSQSIPNAGNTVTTTITTKWVTRDIASLEFLLNIPLAAEREIVTTGYQLQIQRELDYYHSHHPSSASSSSSSPGEKEVENDNFDKKVSFQNDFTTTKTNHIPSSAKGTWWEKWIASTTQNNSSYNNSNSANLLSSITKNNKMNSDADELEQPTEADRTLMSTKATAATTNNATAAIASSTTKAIPGRRLDGDMAIRIQIPVTTITTTTSNRKSGTNTGMSSSHTTTQTATTTLLTKQTSIARQAALREWEIATAFGTTTRSSQAAAVAAVMGQPPMLEGRLFFSANSSYPVSVFSVIRYEPRTLLQCCSLNVFILFTNVFLYIRCDLTLMLSINPHILHKLGKEEAAFRRRKLEAIGGGGSQFVLPNRDWRGISYVFIVIILDILNM